MLRPGDVGLCLTRRIAERRIRARGFPLPPDCSLDSVARIASWWELLSVAVRSDANEDFAISGAWLEGEPVRTRPPTEATEVRPVEVIEVDAELVCDDRR